MPTDAGRAAGGVTDWAPLVFCTGLVLVVAVAVWPRGRDSRPLWLGDGVGDGGGNAGGAASGAASGPTLPSRLPINTATVEELALLKGIGPKLAEAIVEYRAAHGAFETPRGLLAVRGIGEKTLAGIEGAVTTRRPEGDR